MIFYFSKMDKNKCPKSENENTFGKNKYVKIREKAETIKKIKVSHLEKVFKFCDGNFFFYKVIKY